VSTSGGYHHATVAVVSCPLRHTIWPHCDLFVGLGKLIRVLCEWPGPGRQIQEIGVCAVMWRLVTDRPLWTPPPSQLHLPVSIDESITECDSTIKLWITKRNMW